MIALFIIAGFALLLAGGEFLVKGGVGIALRARVSKVVIGLTLIAFATSAPELIVSTVASLRGKTDIAMGNVIGSNIANIGFILGATALIYKMKAVQLTYKKDWQFLLISNAILGFFLWYGMIPRWGGVMLILMLIGYNVQKVQSARRSRLNLEDEIKDDHTPVWKDLIYLLLGAVGLKFGAQLFVAGISDLALYFGMSERLISVTMVAFGTSVPELAASLVAARKGEPDLAIGNIIGSNIFNILSVLGITAFITPIAIQDEALIRTDFPISVLFTLIIIPLMGFFKADTLDRREGGLLFLMYVGYIVYLFV